MQELIQLIGQGFPWHKQGEKKIQVELEAGPPLEMVDIHLHTSLLDKNKKKRGG